MKLHFLKKKPLPEDGSVKIKQKFAFFPVKCDSCKTYLWLEEYLLESTHHIITAYDDSYRLVPYVNTSTTIKCDECLHIDYLDRLANTYNISSTKPSKSNKQKPKSKKTVSKKSSTSKKFTKNQIDIKSKEEFI